MASLGNSSNNLREKQFKVRNSPLTDRFEQNEDIKTIYNLFAIILISLFTNTVIYEYLKTGELHFGLRLIVVGFNNLHAVLLIWCCLNLLGYILFALFTFWAKIHLVLLPKGILQGGAKVITRCSFAVILKKWIQLFRVLAEYTDSWLVDLYSAFVYFTNVKTELTFGAICKSYSVFQKAASSWDKIWISLLVFYYGFSLYGLQKLIPIFELAPCSATVIFLEEIRLIMKQHAFIRSNAPLVMNHKVHSEKTLALPTFGKFVYFTFAPTMLYRDSYPRTKCIRWRFVIYNFAEVFGLIYLLSLVVERFLIPPFEEFCLRKYTTSEVVAPVIANSFPGILFMLCSFYSVLHAFQNAFAEMMRFGDRLFYREWWTSRSLSEYYRTWNVIIHDWLFNYVYKDMYDIVVPKNKLMAKLTVFVISAVTHEWIITNVLSLFLPVQFMQFFVASVVLTVLNLLDLPVGNLLIWYLIVVGSGMQVNLYTLEFFARRNCPLDANSTLDFFMPRFITCGCISND